MSPNTNDFNNCLFLNSDFSFAAIGYRGSKYVDCVFDKCNFKKAIFIRAEFMRCKFIDCKLKGVDFNASSFEECAFVGKLEDVWFRGGFALASDIEDFGEAKKNRMKNVSFEDAHLYGLTFSNDCDLSTVTLPSDGKYFLFNNWRQRLEKLKKEVNNWPQIQRREGEIFANSCLVHAKTQNWYLLGFDDIQKDYGLEVAKRIIATLTIA
jgi:fluoroquinolone resistance protein